MRVFVAGATEALGRQLLPKLVAAGHSVWGMTRYSEKAHLIEAAAAMPVIADALDEDAVVSAIAGAAPEVIVHELTALSSFANLRRFDQEFAQTNRLRTEGTRHLLNGARTADARRFVAESFAGWPFAREGGPVKTEEYPLDPNPGPTDARRDPGARSDRDGRQRPRRDCVALWLFLRPGHLTGRWRKAARSDPPAPVADFRQRRRHMVVRPH